MRASTSRGNLPGHLTAFVGRRGEIKQLRTLLSTNRMISVVGAAGCGKTRLALEVAAQVRDSLDDGTWVVDLAAISNAELVPQQVAAALAVPEKQGQTAMEAVLNHAGQARAMLLVFDSCDQVLTAAAEACEQLLSAGPEVRILVTSREPLGLQGETIWRLPPLSLTVPAGSGRSAASEAVQLFLDRARLVQPSLDVTPALLEDAAAICRQLDGLPLAIELAAARTRMMPSAQILTLLDDRFRLLTSAARPRLAHHQTLRAALDWSCDLLSQSEHLLFQRLSIFAGGFQLEAAEHICAGGEIAAPDVLELLTRLVDKSLVVSDPAPHRARYRLLDTMRIYAHAAIATSAEDEVLATRHFEFFSRLAERLYPPQPRGVSAGHVEELETEDGNLRAALEWALTNNPTSALRFAATLSRFWALRGKLSEGLWWLKLILAAAAPEATPDRIAALNGGGWLAFSHGEYGMCETWLRESLRLQDEIDDHQTQAEVYYNLGLTAYFKRDTAVALQHFEQSLASAVAADDRFGIGAAQFALAFGDFFSGQRDRATQRATESARIRHEIGDRPGFAFANGLLGVLALHRGDRREAESRLVDALTALAEAGERPNVAYGIDAFAMLAAAEGDHIRTIRLASAAKSMRTASQLPPLDPWSAMLEPSLDSARRALGHQLAERSWTEGASLSTEDAVAYALKRAEAQDLFAARDAEQQLSPRELDVAELVARGFSNKELAKRLFISVRTAEAHMNHIFDKLGIDSRTQLTAWWLENGGRAPTKPPKAK